MALELSERHPGDAGVLAALLLNLAVLQPGEALYLPAGNLHAYLSGAGVELMANSDNVLRGGLTSKHVDVPELLRVLDFTPRTPPVLRGVDEAGWVRYDTDAAEFLLRRLEGGDRAEAVAVPDGGPRILLCTAGTAAVRTAEDERTLGRGQAVWLPADDRGVTVVPQEPGTQLFLASDGLDI
jgi:mannose-6-phosphate isomerase